MNDKTQEPDGSLIFNVSASAVRAVASCMAKCDIRYYLNGFYVEPHIDGVIIVATDGHKMLAIIDRTGHAERSVICGLPKLIKKAMPRRAMFDDGSSHRLKLIKTQTDDHQGLILTGPNKEPIATSLEKHLINGAFPDWRKVFAAAPSTTNMLCGMISARYVAALTKGFEKGPMAFRAYQEDHLKQAFIWFENFPEVISCIMPIRSGGLASDATETRPWRETWAQVLPQPAQEEPTTKQAQEEGAPA
jgi:DNA polymerase III beta subunit, central domain